MSWGQRFVDAIESSDRLEPVYLLESVILTFSSPQNTRVRLSSHDVGEPYHAIIAGSGHEFLGTALQPRTWQTQTGGFTVALAADPGKLRRQMKRGMGMQLRVGFRGWKTSRFETVALGVLWNLTYSGGRWVMACRDAFAGLTSRHTLTGSSYDLFFNMPITTTVSSQYHVTDTEIEVAATTGFESQDSSGGAGALRVTPNVGDPFYLTYTGTASGPAQFTGLSTTDLFNTTQNDAGNNNLVESVAYTEVHPINIALRILQSTGTALQNGTRDVLPLSWGLGVHKRLVDVKDAVSFRRVTEPASGSNDWAMLETEPATNPLTYVQDFLKPGGFFLTQRQGRITVRGVVDALKAALGPVSITDIDIVEILAYEAWDSSLPLEYRRFRTVSGDGSGSFTTEQVASMPAQQRLTETLADVHENETLWREQVRDRLLPYMTRIPERIDVLLGGWRHAQLAVGDVVHLRTRMISGRKRLSVDGINSRCLVTAVSPNWFGATTGVTLLIPVNRANEHSE